MSECDCGTCGRCWQRLILEKEGRWLAPPGMLNLQGARVGDHPPELFRFALHDNAEKARLFEPFITQGLSDEEAWEALFTCADRIRMTRDVYGKRCHGPKPKRPQAQLFVP